MSETPLREWLGSALGRLLLVSAIAVTAVLVFGSARTPQQPGPAARVSLDAGRDGGRER